MNAEDLKVGDVFYITPYYGRPKKVVVKKVLVKVVHLLWEDGNIKSYNKSAIPNVYVSVEEFEAEDRILKVLAGFKSTTEKVFKMPVSFIEEMTQLLQKCLDEGTP